ncbi:cobalt/nickel transport system permease protein [Halanaerobium saccharolyticum]|uniref:Cobalt/nickel transport system permease protein n=1 Tax=Halanaerobium saccharolyticum TaxID=43595 RepID=A0A4R7ZD06_9FIRM|nr:cobalt ECF transporter T component CbiQ [Halanaerobium saccharolyticum]RAK10582.1 cobalt/nickel transport system permease protein [Halanaerobium saccharolyticum]TDW06661.1 cobalt/nickel transport system permease protein [Halanaerobium saccharolyticum]TDX62296.1 cobalt/nickel transport system permease protein [Halanaerobium saccharolyticum]
MIFKKENTYGVSWIHQLDPRLKIVIAFITAFLIALTNDLITLSYFLFLAIILIINSKIETKYLFKKLILINFFIIIIWIFIPFTFPGEELLNIGKFSITAEGINFALKITLRSNSIMLLIISLLTTNSVSEIIHALYRLKIAEKLIYLFFFVYRYLHIIKKEYNNLYEAMLMRAFKAKTNLHTYKSYAYLIAMLLIKSYERSQKVYEAMICRGFKGKFIFFDDFKIKKLDILFIIGYLISLSLIFIFRKGLI